MIVGSVVRPVASSLAASVCASYQSSAFSPATLFLDRAAGSWHTAYDNTYLKVNSDGTGGAVASTGTVGRWEDRSGNGNHLSQTTANLRPIYRAGEGLNFFAATNGTTRTARYQTQTVDAVPRAGCAGGFVVDPFACGGSPIVDLTGGAASLAFNFGAGAGSDSRFIRYFNGVGHTSSGLIPSGRKCVITWRSNGADFIVRVNGAEYSLGSALGAADMTSMNVSTYNGGLPTSLRLFESVIYDYDIGASALSQLEAYLRSNAGTYDSTRTVCWYGDSLSCATGSETGKRIQDYITNRSGSLWYSFSAGGAFIFAPHVTAANLAALKGSNEGIAVIWIGTNDINPGTKTGLQTAASIKAYSDTLRTAGMKVVVCTLQKFPNNDAERLACNAQIATDASHYDAIADLAADARLSDHTNTTYYTSDQVHLMDAGYAVAGGIIQAAMASI